MRRSQIAQLTGSAAGGGGPVHWVDFGGSGPTLVCVHGLGGSWANWYALGPLLAGHARVVALDLAGFGRTPLAGRTAAVQANRRLLDRFLGEVIGTPALLVGNSMGGMVSLLQAAARPAEVSGLVLLDPAVPGRGDRVDLRVAGNFALYAVPGVAERYLARRRALLGPERLVEETLRLCTVDLDRVPADARAEHVEMARYRATLPYADTAFLQAARSLLGVLARAPQYRATIRRLPQPALLVQGAQDRLVPVRAARSVAALRPDWRYAELADVGHVPQLEVPERVARLILEWLEGPGRRAAEAATPVAA